MVMIDTRLRSSAEFTLIPWLTVDLGTIVYTNDALEGLNTSSAMRRNALGGPPIGRPLSESADPKTQRRRARVRIPLDLTLLASWPGQLSSWQSAFTGDGVD
jgi:hypothetical protein